jgi:peptide deformylase
VEGFGRALAAPQVGFLIRMIVMNLRGEEITIFNPEIMFRSEDTMTMWDDCLSFPDLMCCVRRHKHISVRFIDGNGEAVEWQHCDNDLSELLQHEIDHLDGVLAVSRAVPPSSRHSHSATTTTTTTTTATTATTATEEFECEAVVSRADWLANKDKYNRLVDFHY